MEPLIIRTEIEISATPARVWHALTDPALTRRYMFGCEPVTDWKVGGPLSWRGEIEGKPTVFVTGELQAFEPERRLRYTVFGLGLGLADVPANYVPVTFVLTPTSRGTRVEVTQGDFAGAERAKERYEETRAAWGPTLERFRKVAEEEGEGTAGR